MHSRVSTLKPPAAIDNIETLAATRRSPTRQLSTGDEASILPVDRSPASPMSGVPKNLW